jgi:hypothetical protein
MIARGARVRALIVVLWRGRAAVQEALALGERDLAPRRGSLPVRRDKGGCRREIGMDAWGWEQLSPGSPRASSYPSGRCCAASTADPRPHLAERRHPRRVPSARRPGWAAACSGNGRR